MCCLRNAQEPTAKHLKKYRPRHDRKGAKNSNSGGEHHIADNDDSECVRIETPEFSSSKEAFLQREFYRMWSIVSENLLR
jgi:hypothetical protein